MNTLVEAETLVELRRARALIDRTERAIRDAARACAGEFRPELHVAFERAFIVLRFLRQRVENLAHSIVDADNEMRQ